MTKKDKLLDRFLSIPADFTWDELIRVLAIFGFEEIGKGKTGGSRRKFKNKNAVIFSCHKPHPGNIVKKYLIRQLKEELKQKSLLHE